MSELPGITPAGPRIELRPITGDDLPFLLSVYAATREDELAQVPWTPEQKAAFVAMQFQAQHAYYQENYTGATFDVVLVDLQPAGRLYVHRTTKEMRIVDIAMAPAFRGRGLGTRILGTLIAESAETGRPITIHVERQNPALTWYVRHGFRVVEDKGVYLFMERPANATT